MTTPAPNAGPTPHWRVATSRGVKLLGVAAALLFITLLSACATEPEDVATPTAVVATPTETVAATPTPSSGTIYVSDLSPLASQIGFFSFSPDGSMFVGRDTRGLVIGSADQTDLQVLEPDGLLAIWSPDSRTLAASVRDGENADGSVAVRLIVMNADGTSRKELGRSDSAMTFQYLVDGRVAFLRDQRLHFAGPSTGVDEIVDLADPIVEEDVPPTQPSFRVSQDGRFLATLRERTLRVQDLDTGSVRILTDSLDVQRSSDYRWSPDGTLAFADVNADDVPALHLFDPATDAERILVHETAKGVFIGVNWSTPTWLLYLFEPHGTVGEELAQYRAIDVTTGANTELFERGIGLGLSGGGRKLAFGRTDMRARTLTYWVATLAFR